MFAALLSTLRELADFLALLAACATVGALLTVAALSDGETAIAFAFALPTVGVVVGAILATLWALFETVTNYGGDHV